MSSAEPVCPACHVKGREYLQVVDGAMRRPEDEPLFSIVLCDRCGHVYGILPRTRPPADTREG